jgi:hypothetical protein
VSWLPILPVLIPLLLNSWATPAADLASATPVSTLRADRQTCILYACAYTVVPGIPLGLAIAFLPSPVSPGDRPFLLLGWGLTTGALTWLLAWLVAGRTPLVVLAHAVLFLKSGSRAALPRLLEDAAARQVLRQAGAVYQFRHSALQKRLANAHLQARPASSEGTSALGGSLTRAQRKACGFP